MWDANFELGLEGELVFGGKWDFLNTHNFSTKCHVVEKYLVGRYWLYHLKNNRTFSWMEGFGKIFEDRYKAGNYQLIWQLEQCSAISVKLPLYIGNYILSSDSITETALKFLVYVFIWVSCNSKFILFSFFVVVFENALSFYQLFPKKC